MRVKISEIRPDNGKLIYVQLGTTGPINNDKNQIKNNKKRKRLYSLSCIFRGLVKESYRDKIRL